MDSNRQIQTIVFDLDGTLIESIGPTIEVLKSTLQAHFNRPFKTEEVTQHFGEPEERMFKSMFGDELGSRLCEKYISNFEKMAHEIKVFDQIREVLQDLSATGFQIGLYTARGTATTRPLLQALKLHSYFESIVTGSDVQRGKPHTDGLLYLLDKMVEVPERVAYVGDTHKDIEMAHAAKSYAVGCTWSTHCDLSSLEQSKPHLTVSSPLDLLKFFKP